MRSPALFRLPLNQPIGIHAGVESFPSVRVGVHAEHQSRAARKGRPLSEDEVDAVEIHAAQIHRHTGSVLQFEEFVERTAAGVIHDLGDAQRDAE
jgi:hypothetical protein